MFQTLFWGLSIVDGLDLALPLTRTGENMWIDKKASLQFDFEGSYELLKFEAFVMNCFMFALTSHYCEFLC